MRSKNQHEAVSPQTKNHDNAVSDDPGKPNRRRNTPGAIGKTVPEKAPPGDPQHQPTAEDFDERGMGIAAKE